MGDIGDVAHRSSTIDDAGDVETSAERSYDRERPERLLHTDWPITDLASWHGDLLDDDCLAFLKRVHFKNSTRGDDDGDICTTTTSAGADRR